ncbi:TIGR01457 family HAD-type hydrolase [Sporosarcina trichiuri]|uniref:TIGR01457 family HAD-type hydrolase n=1 Tax=Sporosarcina trichiuri TaxID=3056445 RepID=UPI0025B441BC|nr:TIGR01457 family HAD-type hydrolase [Sporosarcina sp. 0.2-SM1T-5]WJY27781.1 TIGR01457 family HAD-type hydrolase [Sporosarcina sp. 0.2-SM1T-5]
MTHYKAVCFDLDGTVYKETEPIEESVAFLKSLAGTSADAYFITNNSSHTREQIVRKLAAFGIETDESHIMTSAIAAAEYCARELHGRTIQMIGEAGLEEALAEKGIRTVSRGGDVVVMGIDHGITYDKLADACLSIRAGAEFIATNGDLSVPGKEGLVPGNGAFAELVRSSTGVAPVIVGKPESYMLEFIRQESGVRKDEMIMIGDNYDTDILSGIRYGIDTIHLEGGVTPRELVLSKPEQPTHVFKSLADWKDHQLF